MEVVLLVDVGKALEGLEHNVADEVFGEEFLALLHELVDVHVEELEYKVEGILFEDHFVELHNVWVCQLHERLDLLLANALVPPLVLLLHSLYRHNFPCQVASATPTYHFAS